MEGGLYSEIKFLDYLHSLHEVEESEDSHHNQLNCSCLYLYVPNGWCVCDVVLSPKS